MFALTVATLLCSAATAPPYQPAAEELESLKSRTAQLGKALDDLAARKADPDLLVDVAVYHKAAQWIARYPQEEFHSKRYVADTLAALDRGLARAKELAAKRASWPKQKGTLVRAYRSRVDDSVQPYGLFVPTNYDGRKPLRLDVVLHGRGATLNEVSFLAAHDNAKPAANEPDYLRLDIYGRGNNAYRWAGETDVFEALASVRHRYRVDPNRIVLRGFSMGGAGAWHLGLHYPDRWAGVEAGAGFTETKRYAKLEALPPYQDATLHVYDAADYALNAGNVPFVSYAGEEDAQLQASANIRQQLIDEGLHFTADGLNWLGADRSIIFLVGPQTGHKFHPDSKQQSDKFLNAHLPKTRPQPQQLRFVTYTTRYNECFWLEASALGAHYQRAEITAQRSADNRRVELTTHNVRELILRSPASAAATLTIDGATLEVPPAGRAAGRLVLAQSAGGWAVREQPAAEMPDAPLGKRRGLQGPIDDAFAESFLCVRGSGTPQNRLAHDYSLAALDTFAAEFARWMRGDVRIKDDTAVTPADIENHHLILFGDPASNRLLGQIAGKLPLRWTSAAIEVGGQSYPAQSHALVMIYPNPLNPRRYVVLNSGHTFHEKDFRGTNALLFPRLGDYAVLSLVRGARGIEAQVATAGLFSDQWTLPAAGKAETPQ